MKLMYEEKLEEKNKRILRLEAKNKQYLDIIAEKEANNTSISTMRSSEASRDFDMESTKRPIQSCMMQLQQMAKREQVNNEMVDDSQISQYDVQDMISLIDEAHAQSQDITQKMKIFEREVKQLKKENQELRLEKDKEFVNNIAQLNTHNSANNSLIHQVSQLQEENDQYLGRLSKQDELAD